MPNRVIKDSIKYSEQIDSLTWFEEVLFYRLIVSADDYGCYDGRPVLIKNELFPLKESVTKKAVEDAIDKLASVGLLCKYTASGKPYLFFPTWEKHQRLRNKHRKFPDPFKNGLSGVCQSNDGQTTANCQSEIEVESEVESEEESESEEAISPNGDIACTAETEIVSAVPVISLPLNDGTEYDVLPEQVLKWEQLYPAVDVMQELRNMWGWIDANRTHRKTRTGIKGFITRWLSKAQNQGGSSNMRYSDKQNQPRQHTTQNIFADLAREVRKGNDNGGSD